MNLNFVSRNQMFLGSRLRRVVDRKANGSGGGECDDLSPHETLEMILRKYAPKPRDHEPPYIQYSIDEITKSKIQKSDHTLQPNHEPGETPLLKTLAPDEAMLARTRDHSPLSVRSVCSVNSAKSISNGSTQSSIKLKKPSCIMCKRPDVPGIDRLLRCGQCSRHYHTSCHNPKITTIMLDTSAWICYRCGSRPGSVSRSTPSSASVDARSEALNKPSSLGMSQSVEKEVNIKEETEIQV
ncbi:hypothetical protein K440DRAFT_128052 [Wilcoxina mikolae CBS 423.85]|nr:hypothetical protein K440DRAFT_128052 [Wilcoxina mikolae CBS 423.85]